MNDFCENVAQEHPKAWKYFMDYLKNDYECPDLSVPFEELPFTMQLGVYIEFFNSISTDVELYSMEPEALQDAIKESFATYEEYLFLDS